MLHNKLLFAAWVPLLAIAGLFALAVGDANAAARKPNIVVIVGDELYDLAADISESKDLAAAKPELVAQLNKDYAAWNAQLAEPRW